MFSSFSSILLIYVMILAAMAFFTLLERKALGYFQIRKGPNKVSLSGIPQPLADAVKLFSKELTKPMFSNKSPFFVSPCLGLFLALMMWILYPTLSPLVFQKSGVLFFLIISSLSVYTTLAAGWSSNSKYSLLGALRGVAQTISYEVSMSLILIAVLILSHTLNIQFMSQYIFSPMLLMSMLLMYIWFTTTVAETNRTPFDFAEGESELVSGFNTEYSAGTFAMIFMAEYINIIFMSLLTSVLFLFSFSSMELNSLMLITQTTIIAFMFLLLRASYPRMRYDLLMMLTWKIFLPLALMFLMLLPPFA